MELFIELGTEDLPARFVRPALDGLAAAVGKLLGGVEHGAIHTYGTPRRLVVSVEKVAAGRPLVEKIITGPPAAQGWKDGAPTATGIAFAKGKGADPASIEVVDGPKGKVLAVRRMEGGERTADIVAKGLEAAVLSVPFKKSMRWGSDPVRFGRPLHRVCCVLGGEVVESTVAGLLTVGTSTGHWLAHPEPFAVTGAAQWLAELRARFVLGDLADRRSTIRHQLLDVAAREGLVWGEDEALLDEVTNLVEWPTVIVGEFPSFLLELPPRLLVESMKVNQRYFPMFTPDGRLSARFLVVTNNPHGDPDLIAAGNARVLTARFYDARFFYAEDRKKPLAAHGEKLAGMAWIRGLGTMAWRQDQVVEAALGLSLLVGADPDVVRAAAERAKCDLCTLMVNEFPELQGHVGRLLAEVEGLAPEAALAIEEAYLPRGAGDALPTTPAGRALALADRLVLLGHAYAREDLALIPRGNADPQGIRRAAGGVIQILLGAGWEGDIHSLLATPGLPQVGEPLSDFLLARFRAQMGAEGHSPDVIDAVMAAGGGQVTAMARRIRAIAALIRDGGFEPVRTTFRRVAGLSREHTATDVDPTHFTSPAEHALFAAIGELLPATHTGDDLLGDIVALRPHVDAFFDAVLVMTDDPVARANRLGLLRTILDRVSRYADFSRLSSEAAGAA